MLPWALKIESIFSVCRGVFKQPDCKNQICFSFPILPKIQVNMCRATWAQRNTGPTNVRLWPALRVPAQSKVGMGHSHHPWQWVRIPPGGHPAHPNSDAASRASDHCSWPQDQEQPYSGQGPTSFPHTLNLLCCGALLYYCTQLLTFVTCKSNDGLFCQYFSKCNYYRVPFCQVFREVLKHLVLKDEKIKSEVYLFWCLNPTI